MCEKLSCRHKDQCRRKTEGAPGVEQKFPAACGGDRGQAGECGHKESMREKPMESFSSWVAVAACGMKSHGRTVLEGLKSMERSLTRTGERVRRKEQNVTAVKD